MSWPDGRSDNFQEVSSPMNKPRIIAAMIFLAGLPVCILANAADSAVGEKIFASTCAACHQFKSYAGKSQADLESKVKGIVAGTVKHPKKLVLSADDIANVTTYIANNEPK
jgi:mono/diheme cytochrome c family protein